MKLGGQAIRPPAGAGRFALAAISAAFDAAAGLPGWLAVGAWRFASAVSGGWLIAANTTSPYLITGKRRFMRLSRHNRHERRNAWTARGRKRSRCTGGR